MPFYRAETYRYLYCEYTIMSPPMSRVRPELLFQPGQLGALSELDSELLYLILGGHGGCGPEGGEPFDELIRPAAKGLADAAVGARREVLSLGGKLIVG